MLETKFVSFTYLLILCLCSPGHGRNKHHLAMTLKSVKKMMTEYRKAFFFFFYPFKLLSSSKVTDYAFASLSTLRNRQ